MEGYRFYRKNRKGRQGVGVALYVKKQLECMAFPGHGQGVNRELMSYD